MDDALVRLFAMDEIRRPVLRAAVEALSLPAGSSGLDLGCGVGLQMPLLAASVGAGGRVAGVDADPALIAAAEGVVNGAGRTGFELRVGDMREIPYPNGAFDWLWSADCVGYPAGRLDALLPELVRVLKPGGTLALLGWTSQRVLPGHPALESELDAACSAYAQYLEGFPPERHFPCAARWLRSGGLVDVSVRTFAGQVAAPLSAGERTAMAALLEMLWAPPHDDRDDASVKAWREWTTLPAGGARILDDPGYYATFTYTMFSARRAT